MKFNKLIRNYIIKQFGFKMIDIVQATACFEDTMDYLTEDNKRHLIHPKSRIEGKDHYFLNISPYDNYAIDCFYLQKTGDEDYSPVEAIRDSVKLKDWLGGQTYPLS